MRIRFRHVFMLGGSAAVLAALFATDPDGGISTSMLLLSLVTPVLAIGFAHLARKALHDYPEADARRLFNKASEDPIGAGLALIALSIVIYGTLGLFGKVHAQDVRTFIPPQAAHHLPVLVRELDRSWSEMPYRPYFGALIEHESCISLKHSRCWNPKSQLKTQREEGAGLGQLTRAWTVDGRLRFDALADMRSRHPALGELSWQTIYDRPDLQIRTVILMSLANWRGLAGVQDTFERISFMDAGYNGGPADVQRERRACVLVKGCDAGKWFGHVELHCQKSRVPIYAGRSACDINRHHVADVLLTRAEKYERLL